MESAADTRAHPLRASRRPEQLGRLRRTQRSRRRAGYRRIRGTIFGFSGRCGLRHRRDQTGRACSSWPSRDRAGSRSGRQPDRIPTGFAVAAVQPPRVFGGVPSGPRVGPMLNARRRASASQCRPAPETPLTRGSVKFRRARRSPRQAEWNGMESRAGRWSARGSLLGRCHVRPGSGPAAFAAACDRPGHTPC